jgi:hypothetical protein
MEADMTVNLGAGQVVAVFVGQRQRLTEQWDRAGRIAAQHLPYESLLVFIVAGDAR